MSNYHGLTWHADAQRKRALGTLKMVEVVTYNVHDVRGGVTSKSNAYATHNAEINFISH